jgi:hypothetical protein
VKAKKLIRQHEDHERTLSVAALFGGKFSIDWLLDLSTGKKPSQILAHLEKGVKEGCLGRDSEPGCYGFLSEEIQNKWARNLSVRERNKLHGYIADILMRELPDDENKAHAVSRHLIHIPNDLERCRYLAKAGDLHIRGFRTEEALQCYSKVLDDLSGLTGNEEDLLFSETAIKYSKISTARHDTARVLSVVRSALERAKSLKNLSIQAILKMHMAKNEWLRSRYNSALKQFEEGWSLAQELNDPKLIRSATTFSTFFL